jgi:hypothetical protein
MICVPGIVEAENFSTISMTEENLLPLGTELR